MGDVQDRPSPHGATAGGAARGAAPGPATPQEARSADAADAVEEAGRVAGQHLRELSLDIHRYAQLVARELGVPATDVHAIGVLRSAQDEVSAAILAHALGLTASATTSLIDRMEATGHAVRHTSARDARRAQIEATESARHESRTRFEPLQRAVENGMAQASAEDRAAFLRVLGSVAREVHETTDRRSPR